MGLFERLRRVLRSNLNELISKAENPEKMLNQLISDMNQQLIDSKKSVAAAIADEKKLERHYKEQAAEAEEWERRAVLALKSGKEDLAREALTRKQKAEEYAKQYREQWEQQQESVEKLKEALRSLQQKIEEAQRKKNLLIARAKRAEAQKRIQETISGVNDTSAFETFEQMSRRMDEIEAQNAAMEEIEASSVRGGDDPLEKEFAKLESPDSDADKALEDLKKRIALEDKSGSSEQNGGGSATTEGSDDSGSIEERLAKLKKQLDEEE
ncbi:MAG: PspA/IM30 family protein [Alkalispirochaetaceae bacterium]